MLAPWTTTENSHDDEDDLVDPARVVHLRQDRKRGEQDRHGALEPAPGDEELLAEAQPHRREQRRQAERARDEGERDRPG